MRFYIATKLERAADHNAVRDRLLRLGHTITYDWTEHGSVQADGNERMAEVAKREANGVIQAEAVIVLLPGGRGTHTELGMAWSMAKRVFLHGELVGPDGYECAFYNGDGQRDPDTGVTPPRITRHSGSLADLVIDIHEWTLNP